jgi:membrane protease YdiL (CAAX protease family)
MTDSTPISPPLEKLGAKDYRFIVICLLLLAGTAWYTSGNFYRAFPEASIDFRVNRDDAREIAGRFLVAQGAQTAGYRDAASFSYDDEAKTFLERELGLEKANQVLSSRVRLWRWSYRWFKPQQKEEFRASVTPTGEVAGFAHELAEDTARPAVSDADAIAAAQRFIGERMHRDFAALEFVEQSTETRPHRVDRSYTWKYRDFDVKGGSYRVEVDLAGNEITGYHEFLKIPEQWTRDYKALRSKNELASTIDTAVMGVLLLGLLITIVIRVRWQDVRWRQASIIGLTGMILSFFSSMNSFPLEEFNYPTTDAYASFATSLFLQAVLSALALGGLLFLFTAGAESVYREAFPDKVSLGNLFRGRGLRTKRFFLGAILGITLTSIFICYQTAFYITAYKFGAWSPADVPYDNLLNTKFPWLFVLFGGFFPAISEEFLFRMFAIPFLRKLTRSTVVALIAAGYIWGFGHAGYAQQPFFIRGVEVGTGGVALGIVMLRWGILPTLVWHYSVDAMYSAMLLLRSHNLYFRLSGAASAGIIVLPVTIALIAYWLKGGFEPVTDLLNGDEPGPVEPAESAAEAPATLNYVPADRRLWARACVVLAFGVIALTQLHVSHFGESPKYKLTASNALAKSDEFLRGPTLAMDPAQFRHVPFTDAHFGGGDSLAGQYFLERKPVNFVDAMFQRYRPIQHWETRYFKPLDQEEVTVSIHPETGAVMGFHHTLPEDRPGATLSDDAARALAAAFAQSRGQDVAAMDIKEQTTEKRKARVDHSLAWEARLGDPRNLDQTHYRVEVNVAGDRVSEWRAFWKPPERFERAREAQTFWSILTTIARIAASAGLAVFGLVVLIRNIRRGAVRWKPAMAIGGVAAALLTVSQFLQSDLALKNYSTSIPFQTFQVGQYAAIAIAALFGFIFFAGAAALVISAFPAALAAWRGTNRRPLGKDAAAALIASLGFGLIAHRLEAFLQDRFPALALYSAESPDVIATHAPAISAVAGALMGVVLWSAAAATLALILQRWKPSVTAPLLLIALVAMIPGDARTTPEFALHYGFALLSAAFLAIWCWRFARNNYLAYALAFWAMGIETHASGLLGTAIPALEAQGWAVVAIGLIGAIWVVGPGFAGGKTRSAAAV